TPVNSILFVGAVTLVLSLVGLIGVGKQEAFQLLWNASGVFYALPYLAMFAIPLFGLRGVEPRPSAVLRACALSGLLMTLLYVTVSIVPLVEVESRVLFAAKISGLIVTTNVLGLVIYLVRRKRSGTSSPTAGTDG
ncbi:MAG TPA: amino acid permease, partial [Thermoanaerobaculia bacterium]|nr:amino acid permease [Thermoanaerobaculia bacterium]